MKRIKHTLLMVACVPLLLTGCGGDSDDAPLLQPRQDFTQFVKLQVATTSDATNPIRINGIRFVDRDRNDPEAYDDVLSP